jgi:hypothetical protein
LALLFPEEEGEALLSALTKLTLTHFEIQSVFCCPVVLLQPLIQS